MPYLARLGALFFFSGISGLVYQVLWLRLLSLVFGVTVYAATTVLAGFMAGLGVGSVIGGRFAARTRHPLRLFGVAEVLIGLSALATPAALGAAGDLYAAAYPAMAATPALLTATRFACSLLVLLVPTILMGASLPLLVRASLDRVAGVGHRVGLLYACNTAGAIVGALVTGFYLIGGIGIHAAFMLAAGINLLVGIIGLVAPVPPRAPGATSLATPLPGETRSDPRYRPRIRRTVLAVFGLSGLAALAFEVVWFRILVLLLPATTYAFTTMLAAVLGGIAAGSAAMTPLMQRDRDWPRILAWIEIAIGIVAVVSMGLLAVTYQAGWRTSGTIQASVLAIVPAALLMGMAFPIGARIWAGTATGGEASDASQRVGTLYAVNVGGAILGSVLAGFVLLPWLGSRASLIAVAGLQVAAGCALLVASGRRTHAIPLALLAGLALAVPAALLPDPFATALTRRSPPGERLLWREEGLQMTVSVNRLPSGQRTMYLDGLHQANDSPEMIAVHRLIGHLPMVLHPRPADALVVGLGGGATAGAVAQHRATSVDLVELSGSVVRGADWFRHVNDDVLSRANVRLRVDDGRNHLLLSGRQYDVVTADIIQPIHVGAGNLYSVEYFELARRALKDGGILLQWIGHRELLHYQLIMRTFLRVFPSATLWADGTLLVGSTGPLVIRRAAVEQTLADSPARAALGAIGIVDLESLLRLYTAGPEEMRRFVGEGPVLTDDRPLLEYHRSLPASERPLDLSTLQGEVSGLVE